MGLSFKTAPMHEDRYQLHSTNGLQLPFPLTHEQGGFLQTAHALQYQKVSVCELKDCEE